MTLLNPRAAALSVTASCLLGLGGLCVTSAADAQSAPAASAPASAPSAPVSAAKKALVARVLKAQQPQVEAIGRNLSESSVQRLAQAAGAALQQYPADKRDATARSLDTDIRKYLDETTPLLRDTAIKIAPGTIGPVLEDKFSDDELKQLATWLESPVYKKYQQQQPAMQNALVQKLVEDTRDKIEPRLKALEAKLGATLGDPAAKGTAPAKPAASAGKTQP